MNNKTIILLFVFVTVSVFTFSNLNNPTEEITDQNLEGIWLEKVGFLNLRTSNHGIEIRRKDENYMVSWIDEFIKKEGVGYQYADSTSPCFIDILNLGNEKQKFLQTCMVGKNELELVLRKDQLKIGNKYYQKVIIY